MGDAALLTVGYPILLLGAVELLLLLSRRAYDPKTWREGAAPLPGSPGADRPPWPQSEIGSFYAGLGVVLALLSGFISVAAMMRVPSFSGAPLHGSVLALAAIEGVRSRRLQRRFVED